MPLTKVLISPTVFTKETLGAESETAHSAKQHFWRKLFLHLHFSRGATRFHPSVDCLFLKSLLGWHLRQWKFHTEGSVIFTITTELLSIRNGLFFFGDGNYFQHKHLLSDFLWATTCLWYSFQKFNLTNHTWPVSK